MNLIRFMLELAVEQALESISTNGNHPWRKEAKAVKAAAVVEVARHENTHATIKAGLLALAAVALLHAVAG